MSVSRLSPMLSWQPGQPIPFADYEDMRDEPPEGLDSADVQLIWWCVAASFDRDELCEQLLPTVEAVDRGCFSYSPIAELSGRCRYPWPVIELLTEMLPAGGTCAVDYVEDGESGVFGIMITQVEIWHQLIWRAFDICPLGMLSESLRELRLQRDIGL